MIHFSMCFLDMRSAEFIFKFIFEFMMIQWIRNVCIYLCLLFYLDL